MKAGLKELEQRVAEANREWKHAYNWAPSGLDAATRRLELAERNLRRAREAQEAKS